MTGTKPRHPVVQFHGAPGVASLHTKPLAGLWYVGEAPEWALRHGLECYGVRAFSPAFCRKHNRQCGQLGRPCKDGDACTCWAYQFVAAANAGTEKRGKTVKAPFSLIEPPERNLPPTRSKT